MKRSLKAGLRGVFALMAWPLALLSLFGKSRAGYLTGAHLVALGPGILGDYLRGAYYRWTLKACSTECRISFGVIFSNPDATVEDGVYIGPYSVLGRVRLGRNAQLASLVQVLSGARQHGRNEKGELLTGEVGEFEAVEIGANCWIGAAAIVMATVGEASTVGAGAVVTKEIPPRVIAVGNPARVLRSLDESENKS